MANQYNGYYPQANSTILLRYVDCFGSESTLLDCTHYYGGCSNSLAGIVCQGNLSRKQIRHACILHFYICLDMY